MSRVPVRERRDVPMQDASFGKDKASQRVATVERSWSSRRRCTVSTGRRWLPIDREGRPVRDAPGARAEGALPAAGRAARQRFLAALRGRDAPGRRDAQRRRGELPPDGGGGATGDVRRVACSRTVADARQAAQPGHRARAGCSSGASLQLAPRAARRRVAGARAIAWRRSCRSRSRRSASTGCARSGPRARSSTSRARRSSSRRRLRADCRPTCPSGSRSRCSTSPARRRRSRASSQPEATVVVVLGAGGKSGILCARGGAPRGGPTARSSASRRTRRSPTSCARSACATRSIVADARDPVAVATRRARGDGRPRGGPHLLVRQRRRRRAGRHPRDARSRRRLLLRDVDELHRGRARRRRASARTSTSSSATATRTVTPSTRSPAARDARRCARSSRSATANASVAGATATDALPGERRQRATSLGRGEDDRERRPRAGVRVHLDRAARVLDDALADREAEARALLFRREERDEQVLQHLLRDAGARCRGR